MGTRWWYNGGEATLDSYGIEQADNWQQRIPEHHLAFLRNLSLVYQVGPYAFVHAGIRPGLPLNAQIPPELIKMRKAEISLNVTNLADKKGWSTISIGSATNSYSAYPIAPREWFVTFSVGL